MGVACFIVFEKPADFETLVNGKAVGAAAELLAQLANDLNVKSLSEFFSMSADDVAAAIEDFDLPDEDALPAEQ